MLFYRGAILLRQEEGSLPTWPIGTPAGEIFHPTAGITCYELTEAPSIPGFALVELRASWKRLPAPLFRIAAKGAELLYWDRTTRYCAHCGYPLARKSEISKQCAACGVEVFPTVAPAVLVLVCRGEEALLVHARNFRRNFYGLVAGFVETGESLEECVAREVKEETSLEISDIRYFGSQSWPFPFNLMIGLTARYAGGEIRFADSELSAGGFFSRENPPELASPPSLAREMIDAWLHRKIQSLNPQSITSL